MGFESPLTPPPSVETQPKPLVSPESVAAETQSLATELPSSTSLTEQLAQQAAEQQREARIAELRAELLGTTAAPQEATNQSSPEVATPSQEQTEIERLKKEIESHQLSIEETGRQLDEVDEQIEAIKKEKRYEVRGAIGTPEEILAALLPNKMTGLENLNKILTAITNTSDKERFQTVIRNFERLSDEEVKNMASSLSFAWFGITPARFRNDSVDFKDLPKITGSERVGIAVNELERGKKKVQEVQDLIDRDPDIAANKATRDALRQKYYAEVNVMNDLKKAVETLEQAG